MARRPASRIVTRGRMVMRPWWWYGGTRPTSGQPADCSDTGPPACATCAESGNRAADAAYGTGRFRRTAAPRIFSAWRCDLPDGGDAQRRSGNRDGRPEGFIGFEALLGSRIASQRVLVQVEGTASRLPIQTLADAAHGNASLRGLLLGYVRYFLIQVLQSVACNGLHSVQERFARWLLMAHDRAGTDSFRVDPGIPRRPAGDPSPQRHHRCTHPAGRGIDQLQSWPDHDHRPQGPRRGDLRMLRHGSTGPEARAPRDHCLRGADTAPQRSCVTYLTQYDTLR